MKKRITSGILVLVLVLTSAIVAASAYAPSTEVIQPRWARIYSLTASLDISASGRADCSSSVRVRDSSDSADLTMSLQRSSNGTSWTTVKAWTDSGRGSVSMDESWYVLSGYSYRVKATAEVYNSSGTLVESASLCVHPLLNIELPDPSYLWTSKARLSQEGDGPSFFIHIAFLNILLFPKAVYGTCPLLCCWDRARKRMLISQWSPMIPAAGGTVWDGSLILPSTRDLRFQNFPKIWDWRSNS